MSKNSETAVAVHQWLRTREVEGPELTIGPLTRRSPFAASQWFVQPQGGSATADGRDPEVPLSTVAGALALAKSGDTIFLVGNITEEVTASNLLEDITIVGVGNRPRHADKARDYASFPTYKGISGASWRQAASHGATTPLLKIRGQGWSLQNLLWVPPSDAAAVFLDRNALSDVSEFDASHAEVLDCRFAGGQNSIDVTDCYGVLIKRNTFHATTAAAIMSTGAGVAQPQAADIDDNRFFNNDTHISVAYQDAVIRRNVFGRFATLGIDLTDGGAGGGNYNMVTQNLLSGTYSEIGGYKSANTGDSWGGNFNVLTGGVTAALPA